MQKEKRHIGSTLAFWYKGVLLIFFWNLTFCSAFHKTRKTLCIGREIHCVRSVALVQGGFSWHFV